MFSRKHGLSMFYGFGVGPARHLLGNTMWLDALTIVRTISNANLSEMSCLPIRPFEPRKGNRA